MKTKQEFWKREREQMIQDHTFCMIHKDKTPVAQVIKINGTYIYIKCPFCNKIHRHGSYFGKISKHHHYTHRRSHCSFGNTGRVDRSYYLEIPENKVCEGVEWVIS